MSKNKHTPFPQLIVRLPRVKAPAAVTLGNGIRHAAKTLDDLPPSLVRALALMVVTHESLIKAWTARLAAKKQDKRLQTIMRHERNAVRALYGYLLRLSRMVSEFEEESPAKAKAVIDALFPQGMTFTTQTHTEVYGDMDRRLEIMNKHGWRPRILELGGGPMLRVVEKTHNAYLSELGGAAPQKAAHEENLRELMEAFFNRVRLLVVHTHAWLDDCPDRTEDGLTLLRTIETIGQMKEGASLDAGPSLAKTLNAVAAQTEALASKLPDDSNQETDQSDRPMTNEVAKQDNEQKTEAPSTPEITSLAPEESMTSQPSDPPKQKGKGEVVPKPEATLEPPSEEPPPSATSSGPPYGLEWLKKAEEALQTTLNEAQRDLYAADEKDQDPPP